jgi:MYXO-CTERM domain-containing protein
MTSRFFAIGILAALTTLTAVSAVGPLHPRLHPQVAAGHSALRAYGSRSAQQSESATASKFDAALADISRHMNRVRPGHTVQDLHTLNPAARFIQPADSATPLVLIDAVTTGDPQQLKAALVELGLQRPALYSNDVSGWLPVSQLEAATQRAEVHSIRASMSRTRSGVVTTQGDFVQHSDVVRSANALTGAGVTVGVLSDSYNCYSVYATNGVPATGNSGYARQNRITTAAAMDVTSGDLPSAVSVLEEAPCMDYDAPVGEPNGDEGRAMMQIVHDVAPGAALVFYTAVAGEADFAAGIRKLAAPVANAGAGAKVIVDDVGYFDEPFFQDGLVAQAIDTVEAQGVAYFTSAGNDGTLAYDNNAPVFSTVAPVGAPNAGEHLLNFDTSGATTAITLPVSLPSINPGDFIAVVVQWDQPFVTGAPSSGGATSQINVCVNVDGNNEIVNDNLNPLPNNCTGANKLHTDPVQIILVGNPANAANNGSDAQMLNIQVGLVGGTTPGRIKVAVEGDGYMLTFNNLATPSPTIQGHSSAAGAMSVGAALYFDTPACGETPAVLEYYSSAGGDPILFDANGVRLPTPVVRQKPDLVGPDGGSDTFLGGLLGPATTSIPGCENNASFPNFQGTSAAAPHVASIAALLLQANPALTPTQLYTALQQTALPMNGPGFSFASGFGFVQAAAAAEMVPVAIPAAPTLTLSPSSVMLGKSATIAWSSANNQGCTASGTWSGALAASGTQTVTPSAVGSYPYTLTCKNIAGTSVPTSATLNVVAAGSGGGGGGGEIGFATLLGLGGLFSIRLRRSMARRCSSNRRVH